MAAFIAGLNPRDDADCDRSVRRWKMTNTNRTFLYWLATMAACTGMRRGELLALRWIDIDLAHGRVRVHRALEQTKQHGIRLKAPKNGNERTVWIPPQLTEMLGRYRTQQKEEWLLLGSCPKSEEEALVLPVAPDRPDEFCPLNSCSSRFSKYVKTVGLAGLQLHGLRHSHASQLIALGYGIADVARTLGHSSPAITMKTYAHSLEGAEVRMAAEMGRMLDKTIGGR